MDGNPEPSHLSLFGPPHVTDSKSSLSISTPLVYPVYIWSVISFFQCQQLSLHPNESPLCQTSNPFFYNTDTCTCSWDFPTSGLVLNPRTKRATHFRIEDFRSRTFQIHPDLDSFSKHDPHLKTPVLNYLLKKLTRHALSLSKDINIFLRGKSGREGVDRILHHLTTENMIVKLYNF
jgi:hypothetical protein